MRGTVGAEHAVWETRAFACGGEGDGVPSFAAARRFPCGLEQPAGAFRFSADALLLACFAPPPPAGRAWRMADLGTGCGVAACALGLRHAGLTGWGIEIEAPLAEAARRNVARLGLADRLEILHGDLGTAETIRAVGPGSCDLVAANPPYREEGSGRRSPLDLRQRALAAPPGTLDAFCGAASALLRHHGYFVCVFGAERVSDLLDSLRRHRLGLRRLRCVHARPGRAAALVLVEARKDARPATVIEPPLILHADDGGPALSAEAAAFCPWLEKQGEPRERHGR